MRVYMLRWLMFFVFYGLAFAVDAQDSTRSITPDTLRVNKISVTPYYSVDQSISSFYTRKFYDSKLLNMSAGVNIFNVLRGRVPGLAMPPYVQSSASSSLRTGPYLYNNDALVVIDGVAFNTQIDSYLNLNAFDFTDIATFSSTGDLNFLGGVNSGAFSLTSKTGEGILKPRFEFNSATIYGWSGINNVQSTPIAKIDEWNLVNAISFSQDFGALDTRISYTNQRKLFMSNQGPFIHNLKINTGLFAGGKFDLRLIADGRFSKVDDVYSDQIPTQSDIHKKSYTAFAGLNLIAKYKLTRWLVASSQLATNNYKSETNLESSSYRSKDNTENLRHQGNLFFTASSKRSHKITMSGSAGIQYLKQNFDRNLSITDTLISQQEAIWNDVNPAFISNLALDFYRMVFVYANYRLEKHSAPIRTGKQMQPSNDNADAYTVSSAFAFGKFFDATILSFGKLRATVGTHNVYPFNNYPISNVDLTTLPLNRQIPHRVNSVESGVDLGFLGSRLLVTLNYFKNQEQYDWPNNVANVIDSYHNRGWETDIRFKARQMKDFSFEGGFVFNKLVSRGDTKSVVGKDSKPYLRSGVNAMATYKSIVIFATIESLNYSNNNQTATTFDTFSFTKLREVSIGFPLPIQFAKETILSISGRNLIKLGGSGTDWEVTTPLATFQKSLTINLNIVF